jgi:hypothetical protein
VSLSNRMLRLIGKRPFVSCPLTGSFTLQGEHTVIAVLSCYGVVIYGASQYIASKKAAAAVARAEAAKEAAS